MENLFPFADDCLAIDKVGCLQLIIHVAYRLSVEINAVLPYEPSPLALRRDQFGFKQDIKQLQSVRKLLTADDCFRHPVRPAGIFEQVFRLSPGTVGQFLAVDDRGYFNGQPLFGFVDRRAG